MRRLVLFTTLLLAACGGNGSGDGGGPDGNPGVTNECREGASATSDSLLPMEVGDIWRYQVTEVGTGNPPYTKRQELTEEMTPPDEIEPVIVQLTTKATGQTVNWLRRTGDQIVRVRQEDYDQAGLLERITVYEPPKLRLDESPERIAVGASFDESYTAVVYDPAGVETGRTPTVDHWVVVSDDTPCDTPWGTLSCVQIHRETTQGGISIKDYYFARGYGKVREDGGQIEELTDCTLR